MSILTRPPPPRSDEPADAEALEALIEEARRRARRRRRGYAASALVAAAAGLLGFYGFNHGGGATPPSDHAERPQGEAGLPPEVTGAKSRPDIGLEGGAIRALALDPQHPSTVFAATLEAGVFKSSNGGRNWRALDIAPSANRVDALAIAPQDQQAVYAGTAGGIFKSTDGGATWQAVNSGLFDDETAAEREHRLIEGFVFALAVGGTHGQTLYAAAWGRERGRLPGDALRKSTNGGASWQRTTFKGGVTALAIDPADPGTVYVGGVVHEASGAFEVGVYKSTDGGASWRAAGLQEMGGGVDGVPSRLIDGRPFEVNSLAIAPTAPETIYAGTPDGVFASSDGGTTWHRAGLEGNDIQGLILDPKNPENVYAESKGRLFVSTNGGRTWPALNAGWAPGTWPTALVLNPRNPATLYVGTITAVDGRGDVGAGVFKSVDGGNSWRPMNAGLTDARVSALAVDPRRPGMAYAAIDGRGVFKGAHGTWRAANTGLTDEGVRAVAVDPRHPATVYAGDGGVFKSTNGGASWHELKGAHKRASVSALAVDPREPTTVYAIASEDGIFKSTDRGASWRALARGFGTDSDVAALALDPVNAGTVYVGGVGLFKSNDGGATWRSAGLKGSTVYEVALDPKDPSTVYAGTNRGLVKSTDAGANWQAVHGRLDGVRVEALAIDPKYRRTVYAGTDRGVFWTTDGGYRWRRFTRVPLRTFDALAVDRAAGVLYAGAYGGGIYELKLAR